MKKVYIRTFGCQMNVHDSEKMLGVLQKDGYLETDDPRKADLIIFNTCGIRKKPEQKFYSELGKTKLYKKRRPELKVAVAGCIAQHEGRSVFTKAPYVDFIFGPQNIHMLHDMISKKNLTLALEDNPEIAKNDLPVKRADEVKAWVTIMYGCNNFCSYCVVPYTRGRERSRPSENICAETKELAHRGYKEVTLLGQNVNSYRSDINFPELLIKIDRVGGIERIRFVTSHPRDLSDELIYAIAELPRVCEHIHLPLQSGSNNVLRLMNRGYTYEDYIKKVLRLRDKVQGIAITSDIIAGFPGETEDDHLHTVKALKQIEFDGIFSFKFSSRPGTRAAEMGSHLPEEVKSERLQHILEVQEEITERKNRSLEGTTQAILIEGESETDKEKLTGRTRTNKIVNIPKVDPETSSGEKGTLINVEVTKGRKHSLEGRPITK
ncbi:MAG: tRNA (N6-isopentenyl adenosine(37)-C2)-methylthiotransferase MiaB [Nitrospira sp.]|nr:tRNA (N6-isopentenyl adenosine(37)-C2)-methylthiotransferase MiaB [Nitrospira sp.]